MAEDEPGHADELALYLRKWLSQANSPIGSLPVGTDPVDWAVRQFIDCWKRPVRQSIESIEDSLRAALRACEAGDIQAAAQEIDNARQEIGEGLRHELGLHEWNKE